MIAKQKAQEKKVNVTTILFDDEVDTIHDRFPVEIIEPFTEKEYFVHGCTALLDAVGTAIEKMENVQKHLPEDHRAGKEAEKIGIARNRSVTYENDSEGIAVNFRAVGNALSKAVTCDATEAFVEDDWKDEIEEYHEKSHRQKRG